MATYRQIYISFWSDTKVCDDFSPEDKYFYIYLLTNPHTNICGCYEISSSQMTQELGYNEESVKKLLRRMEQTHDVIRYNWQKKELLILNWHKYNWTKSPKMVSAVRAVAQYIKTDEYRVYILSTLERTINGQKEPAPQPAAAGTLSPAAPAQPAAITAHQKTDEEETMSRMVASYEQNIGPIKRAMFDAMRTWWLSKGVEPDMICAAMDEAAMQNAPNWTYAEGILRRCLSAGITTLAGFRADQKHFQSKRKGGTPAAPADQQEEPSLYAAFGMN